MAVAIEFRCSTCGKLLRTGTENVGRPAACPACGDRLEVPREVVDIGEKLVSTVEAPPPSRPSVQPHRGGLVLAFGILSWAAFCFLFGVAAWVIGAQDLRAMRNGEMDPSGESLTRAGMILGIVNVAVVAVAFIGLIGLGTLAALFG